MEEEEPVVVAEDPVDDAAVLPLELASLVDAVVFALEPLVAVVFEVAVVCVAVLRSGTSDN